jgi:putative transposase
MDIPRSSLYYERKGESPMNLQLMQEIDRVFIDYPTTGAKKMTARLRRLGYEVNVKRVRRLM